MSKITHDEAKNIAIDMLPKSIGSNSSKKKLNNFFRLEIYFKQQEKESKLLELYQRKEHCIVCVPHQNTTHCVVRYSDDEKYYAICQEIYKLEKQHEIKDKLLKLYQELRKQVDEYNDTTNKTPRILHLALHIQDTLDEIEELKKEIGEIK